MDYPVVSLELDGECEKAGRGTVARTAMLSRYIQEKIPHYTKSYSQDSPRLNHRPNIRFLFDWSASNDALPSALADTLLSLHRNGNTPRYLAKHLDADRLKFASLVCQLGFTGTDALPDFSIWKWRTDFNTFTHSQTRSSMHTFMAATP
ncbi:hypothetical protein BOTBODRAFT_38154 [Botryobasidium botryosum FD-172 SS1]|uniref:Uncharacterized protein n=1 Tax=Botryobasidium botryosum (strain FD-172 SS1) TaxID=930990 RepID=A0A067M8G5_BOTB1|nr:hypothetical protein BOTBODRAFT_38154 [Botryobasidium botryosum FD-172 SS1]